MTELGIAHAFCQSDDGLEAQLQVFNTSFGCDAYNYPELQLWWPQEYSYCSMCPLFPTSVLCLTHVSSLSKEESTGTKDRAMELST